MSLFLTYLAGQIEWRTHYQKHNSDLSFFPPEFAYIDLLMEKMIIFRI